MSPPSPRARPQARRCSTAPSWPSRASQLRSSSRSPSGPRATKRGRPSSSSYWPRNSSRGGSFSWKTQNFRLEEPALTTSSTSVRPGPVGDLRAILPVLVGVREVVEDRVAHLLLQVSRLRAHPRHAIDDVDHQVESRGLVEDRQLEGGVD